MLQLRRNLPARARLGEHYAVPRSPLHTTRAARRAQSARRRRPGARPAIMACARPGEHRALPRSPPHATQGCPQRAERTGAGGRPGRACTGLTMWGATGQAGCGGGARAGAGEDEHHVQHAPERARGVRDADEARARDGRGIVQQRREVEEREGRGAVRQARPAPLPALPFAVLCSCGSCGDFPQGTEGGTPDTDQLGTRGTGAAD